jgi:hypothetical protein
LWMQPVFRYPYAMIFKEIELEKIDSSEELFRITENIHSESVLESVRAVGQINPVILMERRPQLVAICGFRRIYALKRLGSLYVLARILPENSCNPLEAFHLALWDNLSHRQLDPMEKARTLFKLKNSFSVSEDILINRYLPSLGLSSHSSVLHSYMLLCEIHPDLRRCLVEGRLTLSSVEIIAQMAEEAQECIAALMDKIRLSSSLQKKFLDLLGDLAAIEDSKQAKALDDPEALSIVGNASLSPFQKGENLCEFLYRKRNPMLSQATKRFCEQRKLLKLPGSIKIAADKFFENPGVRVEFQAPNAASFREMAEALQKTAQSQAIEELFQI